jgi:riboflavin biosynthesis pyrimidine reductase
LILQEVVPNPGGTGLLDLVNSEALQGWYPAVAGLRVNFVLGRSSEVTSNSDALSNEADRTLLKFIRQQSDLIVTTGKTARAENLSASNYANLLIVTNSDAPLAIPATDANKGLPVMVTQRLETDYPNVSAGAIGKIQEPITQFVMAFCRANSYKHPVLESGPTTITEFAKTNLIAEMNLTVTGSRNRHEAEDQALAFLKQIGFEPQLIQILNHEKTWFFRFVPAATTR